MGLVKKRPIFFIENLISFVVRGYSDVQPRSSLIRNS